MTPEAELDNRIHGLAVTLEARIDELVEAMVERLLSEPDLKRYDEPHFRDLTRNIPRENLLHEIHLLGGRRELPDACPPEAALAARQAVQLDAPVTVVLQCYRAGHAVLWEAWLDLVEQSGAVQKLRRRLLEAASEFMFAYVERCTGFVVEEYSRTREVAIRGRDYQRLQLVRRVLEGEDTDVDELGYPLSLQHVGVVASGPGGEAALRAAAAELGRRSLVLAGDDGTVWGWIGRPSDERRSPADRLTAHLARIELPDDSTLANRGRARGPEGVRRTHPEAQAARIVSLRSTLAVAPYGDVSLAP